MLTPAQQRDIATFARPSIRYRQVRDEVPSVGVTLHDTGSQRFERQTLLPLRTHTPRDIRGTARGPKLKRFLIALVGTALALTTATACQDDNTTVEQAVATIKPVVQEMRASTQSLGLTPSEIEQSDELECRSGQNKRDGTAQVSLDFRVDGVDTRDADRLIDAVRKVLLDAGAEVTVESEPDMDRRRLRGTRGSERFSVVFSFGDGGRTATVGGSTGCHRSSAAS